MSIQFDYKLLIKKKHLHTILDILSELTYGILKVWWTNVTHKTNNTELSNPFSGRAALRTKCLAFFLFLPVFTRSECLTNEHSNYLDVQNTAHERGRQFISSGNVFQSIFGLIWTIDPGAGTVWFEFHPKWIPTSTHSQVTIYCFLWLITLSICYRNFSNDSTVNLTAK